jgi:hypothetical protein
VFAWENPLGRMPGSGPDERGQDARVAGIESGRPLSAQDDRAENKDRQCTGDRTNHQRSTHGFLLSRRKPSFRTGLSEIQAYADLCFLLRRTMRLTTMTARVSATTRTIMLDSM